MTATTNEITAPRRGLVAAVRDLIPRNEFFAGLYILGLANGLVGRLFSTSNFDDWTGIALSLDLNVIVLFACFAGVSAFFSDGRDGEQIRPRDVAVAAVFLMFRRFFRSPR